MLRRVSELAVLLLLFSGCERAEPGEATTPSSPAPVPTPSASAAPAAPWFEGAWEATFETEAHRVDLDRKQGAPKEWEAAQTRGAGSVMLSLDIDPAGQVTGSTSGALGNTAIRGTVEDELVRVRLKPMDPSSFQGTLVLEHQGETLVGALRAASSDGLAIRRGTVTLRKKPVAR